MTEASAAPPVPPHRPVPRPDTPGPGRDAALRRAATEFEAAFLAEMLSAAGLGRVRPGFGGGPGEEAFASLLVREQAALLARRGGLGLADAVFRALRARETGRG